MTSLFSRSRTSFVMAGILCLLFAAAPSHGKSTRVESGIASWYGAWHHGKITANGEAYDMFSMTAAHKTIPLGTLVRVRHKRSGKSLIVRINDRGPYVKGRIIDLSYAAASSLGITGISRVTVEVVSDRKGRLLAPGQSFFVRLGKAPQSFEEVEQQLGRLIRLGLHDAASLLHVRDEEMAIGPYSHFKESQAALDRVATTHPGASIILSETGAMEPAALLFAQR